MTTEERKKISTNIANEMFDLLEMVHKKTRVPRNKLLDEAIEDLAKKYDIKK